MIRKEKITPMKIVLLILCYMFGLLFPIITIYLLYYPIKRKTRKYISAPTFEERNYISLK